MASALPSLGVVIPSLNAARSIGATLDALSVGRARFRLDIAVADGGSADDTIAVAEARGARAITVPPGRGGQLAAGAAAVAGDWLLFVHADTRLEDDGSRPSPVLCNGRRTSSAPVTFAWRSTIPRLRRGGSSVL